MTATSIYSVHPSVAYARSIINNLGKKTGRTIDEWIELVNDKGPHDEKERREWLKKQFKLGGTTAWMIVDRVEGRGAEDTDPDAYLEAASSWVEGLYSGPKASLRPIHDALVELGRSMGDDVRICPCKTIVPLYRNHVFAEIKPSTQTRVDFGLALKDATQKPPKRLIETGGLKRGDRITHRFPITSVEEIDDQVRRWLAIAYGLDT